MMAVVPAAGLSTLLVAMHKIGACVACNGFGMCLRKLWYDGLSSGSHRMIGCPVEKISGYLSGISSLLRMSCISLVVPGAISSCEAV